MNTLEKITTIILIKTGYRFPKHEGLFCRDSKSRNFLRSIGIRAVVCNIDADFQPITKHFKDAIKLSHNIRDNH